MKYTKLMYEIIKICAIHIIKIDFLWYLHLIDNILQWFKIYIIIFVITDIIILNSKKITKYWW